MRDRHHILNNRQEWRLRPEAKALRENITLIPNIPREIHEEIHTKCPPVPLLGYHALVRVTKEFQPNIDTMRSMDSLMLAIERSAGPRTHQIERDLAQLAVWAIDLQRPFIEEGLSIPDTRTIIDLGVAA